MPALPGGSVFRSKADILPAARQLLKKVEEGRPVRLIGLGVSNAEENPEDFEAGTLSF